MKYKAEINVSALYLIFNNWKGNRRMKLKRLLSVIAILSLAASLIPLSGCGQDKTLKFYKVDKNNLLFESDTSSYSYYLSTISKTGSGEQDISLSAENVSNAHLGEYEIELDVGSYVFLDQNSKWAEWSLNVPDDGVYTLKIDYRASEEDSSDLCLSLSVDGEYPYIELENLTLPRLWADDCGAAFDTDTYGNDIRPSKKQVFADQTAYFLDDNGLFADGYKIALAAGTHTLRLSSVKGGVLVKNLILETERETVSYNDYIKTIGERPTKAKENIVIEAEHPLTTSASNLYAVSDMQDAGTTPNSPKATRLNTIGDYNWRHNGQTITWEFEVENDGLYAVNIRARQDYNEGMTAYRSLKIDDKTPFKEAESIKFGYNFNWQSVTLGGEKPQYVYLDKGRHTVSMAATPGDLSELLLKLENLILDLNTIYRKIVIITGTTVDVYQDYSLDTKIPELINSLKDCRNRILEISRKIKSSTGMQGSKASVLDETVEMLDNFVAHPYKITGGLAGYKTKVEDIASLLTNMSEQALLIDKITLVPKGNEIPSNKAAFHKKVAFSVQKFIYSYFNKKDDTKEGKTVKVWVNTGRDQAQIIKQMISNEFVNKKHINIELNIVDTGSTLIQAALANKGPDAAFMIAHDTPVNLAMRGGLIELSDLGLDDIYGNYYDSAWTPFKYQDGIYAIPETQVFDMLFVRDDIFKELDIDKVPDTWDEFYSALETIQNNSLIVGIAETNSASVAVSGGISTFSKLYFQNGGTFYNDDFSATTFESELSIYCLTRVCELYTKYGLDREFNFFNRFRSGEMAMGIAPYNSYNQLVAAAPEIEGLWSMHPIPGTVDKNGSINRAESSSGTASIILKAAKENNVVAEAFEFIKWWNDSETQSEFAERLEGVMGAAARYTPANIKAFYSIKWSESEKAAIKAQWEQVVNVREIPGNYYISRALTSAIRNTINKGTSVRFNIAKYNNDINSEITRKRAEFGLTEKGKK